MSKKFSWEKNFVVYHVKHKTFHKAFDLESSAKRSASCATRNTARRDGETPYVYTTWDNYFTTVSPNPK